MNRRDLKRLLKARRAEVRRELGRRRAQARERARKLDPGRSRRRRRWILVALMLLLLLLLRDCSCAEVAPAPPPESATGSSAKGALPAGTPSVEPLTGQMNKQARGDYENEPQGPPSWITAFRLQVAARSPRLAECFVGAERPGMLRWTVGVDPKSGVVTDHELETARAGEDLTKSQRGCVQGVLSDPPYRLTAGDEPTTPARVAIVIEF